MLRKLLIAVALAMAAFVAGGILLPKQVHVERTIQIERPAATVFTLLNGFASFREWSPWLDRDPDAIYTFSGPDYGVGARMSWSGDPRMVGDGWEEITGSEPYRRVSLHINFENQGEADTYFRIDRAVNGVRLTWGFDADLARDQGWLSGLLARYFGLFFDRWIGSDYEQGLSRFKAFAESLPPADFADLDVQLVDVPPIPIVYIAVDARGVTEDVEVSLAAAYVTISAYMQANGIERLAPPLAITRAGEPGGYEFDAAIPVILPEPEATPPTPESANGEAEADNPLENASAEPASQPTEDDASTEIRFGQSPSGRAVRVIHRGPYSAMAPTYARLAAWMAAHGMTEGRVSWEQYVSDPAETPEEDLLTYIYFLVADQEGESP